ncbi:MAG: isoleucine--tRNA ligase [Actinobacteria bacterium]|nr:MAG: isoleucine--tRNA ligase [Actinomycetota bacterium]
MFALLPDKPDHIALEEDVLAWWEAEGIFDRLREQTSGGPKWSFMDGPITANNPMAAHHCWGRTLKDVFQRYKAMRGFELRYQNGFDCQGLWVEVGVERSLGLNSKREIEEYGLAEFNERCKERVTEYAEVITEQSKRLGQWMDWDNDYYTFSDTNIEYIWRFLKECHARRWLYKGHRSVEWCPRCGTSLSQHELINSYEEMSHPSLYVRLPLRARKGESLVVWTTTPWTLPANVAAAVKPDAEYGLTRDGEWWAIARKPDGQFVRRVQGEELVGLEYEGPFDELPAQRGVVHRVIPWDDVTLEEGTGIVHIAPGCGAEDFELAQKHDLPVLMPINEAGIFYADYGEFEGRSTEDVEKPIVVELERRGRLVEAGSIVHRYPVCWRCATPLVFRIADDWLIRADEIRRPMLDANATVEWTPSFYKKRMDDWLRNMDDWNISRRRYFGLPLPFFPCECGTLNVIGSLAELRERATSGLEQLKELHRPWIDDVPISCAQCGREVRRIPEVGDAWLDAGIVPFSTLGWQNEKWVEHGYASGASAGVSGADLPDHAYWEKWFPADWVSEMREQIRLWFYSQSFMSVTLVGRSPYKAVLTYEKLGDETGREMHRSWGNSIDAAEALQNMGADVMRWMFCEQVPSQNLRFGYGPAAEIRRRLLTFWNSVKFFVDYANVVDFSPTAESPGDLQPLDRWLLARTEQLVAELTDAYERFWTPDLIRAFESFVDDLSNWYIRRSRRRFWNGDTAALWTLWSALTQSVRVVGPVMPFLAEHLWRVLRTEEAPESVFLVGWPEVQPVDEQLLAEIAEVRQIVELGRQARGELGLKMRQPIRRLHVYGARFAESHEDELLDELRAKELDLSTRPLVRHTYKPNLPVLGPKLGKELSAVREALAAHDFESLQDGRIRVAGHELSPDELIIDRAQEPGWAHADSLAVGVDPALDDELLLEGRVLDLIHLVNAKRKDAGLELTDRIRLTLPETEADLLQHEQWIKDEVLAVEIQTDGVAEPQITKA